MNQRILEAIAAIGVMIFFVVCVVVPGFVVDHVTGTREPGHCPHPTREDSLRADSIQLTGERDSVLRELRLAREQVATLRLALVESQRIADIAAGVPVAPRQVTGRERLP